MKFLLTIIQAAGLGCASAAAGRRVLHYLQLESYQLPGYVRSVRRNAMRALIPPIAMAAVGVAALRLSGLTGLALLLEALTARCWFGRLRRKRQRSLLSRPSA